MSMQRDAHAAAEHDAAAEDAARRQEAAQQADRDRQAAKRAALMAEVLQAREQQLAEHAAQR